MNNENLLTNSYYNHDTYNKLLNKYTRILIENQRLRTKVKELNDYLLESIKREEFMEKELKMSLKRESSLEDINNNLEKRVNDWKLFFGDNAPDSVKYILDKKEDDIESYKSKIKEYEKKLLSLRLNLEYLEKSKIQLAKDYIELMN